MSLQSERDLFETTFVYNGEPKQREPYERIDYTQKEHIQNFLTASHRRILTALLEKCAGEREGLYGHFMSTITHADDDLAGVQARSMELGAQTILARVKQIINELMEGV